MYPYKIQINTTNPWDWDVIGGGGIVATFGSIRDAFFHACELAGTAPAPHELPRLAMCTCPLVSRPRRAP